ncbi:MAG TPA: copper amine oxidase N-terminal domain-containing protein [Moorella mulderi]|nr:copper amine oxidase N-terminal domain-containing protein [Moorella mulderi]
MENSADFPGKDFVAKVAIAKCVTPAPPETVAKAVFKIGEKKYTVDGKEYLMDVAPYIEEGRTYVPLRYAAYACGVEERNILWDDVTLTATILKGDRVVQMTLGSYFMVVNGVQIPMDVKVQAKDGRIMLPIRWLSPALGFPPPDWKEDTQEVVILCNVTQVPGQAS